MSFFPFTEFVEKESRRTVADQKVSDAVVTGELLVNLNSVCESDSNEKSQQNVCDSDEATADFIDHIAASTSRNHFALTPVTENDPLGLFGTKGGDRNYCTDSSNTSSKQLKPEIGMSGKLNSSFPLDVLKNLGTESEPVSSKSKSCDELNTDIFTEPSSKALRRMKRRRGSIEAKDNAVKVSEVLQDHAKTLSQMERIKLEDESKVSIHRTGSFGNVWHSAVNLFNSTYHNLRGSWSAGGYNIPAATDKAGSSSDAGFLLPLQSAQRACSADNLSIEQGRTTLATKQLTDDNLAGGKFNCYSKLK